MQIIVLFIPSATELEEFCRFVRTGLGNPLAFWRRRKILSCDIIDIRDPTQASEESHGLISVADPDDARQIIERLNGSTFKGQQVQVREYHNRTPGDRRINRILDEDQGLHEARRKGLKVRRRIGLKKKPQRPRFFKLYDERKSAPFTPPESQEKE
jgi:hypothetical protein